ncbi:MAG TPA: type VI secretion system ATPase TssH [Achromobacter sp.]|nr:type VI secretion system ATPase TssH [Achromobacter sp.]
MIRIDLSSLIDRLNPICRQAVEEAASLCISQHCAEITVAHVLTKLVDQPLSDMRVLIQHAGLDADSVRQALAGGNPYHEATPGQYPSFSPLLIEWLQEAWLLASLELAQVKLRGGSLALAALLNPGRYLPLAAITLFEHVNREALRKTFNTLFAQSAESPGPGADAPATPIDGDDTALARYGHDFTAQARAGTVDPVLCRDAEIDLMIDILSRRRKNNPIVVGDAGVGKSAVVEGLALRIVQQRVPEPLRHVALWGLDLGALQAGASVKGEFEKRLKSVIDQVKASAGRIVLFIDEAHTLIGAGNVAGGSDAANLLKPALARGELRTIAATTWSEYKKYFEKDPALTRRFQLVKLEEPTQEQAVHILRGLRATYEHAHRVYIGDDALRAAVSLSARYLSGRQLPDKAIDVLDTASARVATALAEPPRRLTALEHEQMQITAELAQLRRDARAGRAPDPRRIAQLETDGVAVAERMVALQQAWERQQALVDKILGLRAALPSQDAVADTLVVDGAVADGDGSGDGDVLAATVAELHHLQRGGALLHADVGHEQIAQVIADWTGIPATTISRGQMERLTQLPDVLRARIKGQDAAIDRIHKHLLTAMADLRRPGTPLGAFLLAGPSGVGKTETALALADILYGGERKLITINMSEYQEAHSISGLKGSPPGYVGYGEGGVLTEAVRRQPYSVVLLDEIEKAHPDVLEMFFQVFDKGVMDDAEGREIDFRNTLIILTSNVGSSTIMQACLNKPAEERPTPDQLTELLAPQLYKAFKPAFLGRMKTIPYFPVDDDALAHIIGLKLARIARRVQATHRAAFEWDEALVEAVLARCTEVDTGARNVDHILNGALLPEIAEQVLGRMAQGEAIAKIRVGAGKNGDFRFRMS